MPSRKKHTNPFLLLIAIALCLVLGITLRQSTADFSILEETSSSMTASSDNQKQDKTDSDQKENSAPSATASPTPAKKPSDSKRNVSDEAASGVWTSSGSNWLFMVDGKAHTGWIKLHPPGLPALAVQLRVDEIGLVILLRVKQFLNHIFHVHSP